MAHVGSGSVGAPFGTVRGRHLHGDREGKGGKPRPGASASRDAASSVVVRRRDIHTIRRETRRYEACECHLARAANGGPPREVGHVPEPEDRSGECVGRKGGGHGANVVGARTCGQRELRSTWRAP